jgi:hypothetical protein
MTTLFEQLVGTWELVSLSASAQDGSVFYPFGEDATGYITYTRDGFMSAQLMRSGRPAYGSADIHAATLTEMASAAAGYVAYAGRFEVDEDARTVRHHVAVSLIPNWVDSALERSCEIAADRLVLSPGLEQVAGVTSTLRVELRRAPPHQKSVR